MWVSFGIANPTIEAKALKRGFIWEYIGMDKALPWARSL